MLIKYKNITQKKPHNKLHFYVWAINIFRWLKYFGRILSLHRWCEKKRFDISESFWLIYIRASLRTAVSISFIIIYVQLFDTVSLFSVLDIDTDLYKWKTYIDVRHHKIVAIKRGNYPKLTFFSDISPKIRIVLTRDSSL